MKMINKRWLKRKGCKNVALFDIEKYDEDGEKYIETIIRPYYKNREFIYLSPRIPLGTQLYVRNLYINDKGEVTCI